MSDTVEVRSLCLVRVPPGDRWKFPEGEIIHPTLTEGLNAVFTASGTKEFFLSAGEGKVFSVAHDVAKPAPVKKFSLYGEEM